MINSSKFINDCISETDYLDYLPYVEAFEYLICNHNNLMTLPIVFGIHGRWGVGKSTFMSLVKQRLDQTKKFFTFELNPWEYGNDKNFVSTFLAKLYKVVEGDLNDIEKKQPNLFSSFVKSILKPLKVSSDFKFAKAEYDFSKLSFDSQKQIIDDFISENYALKETISYILDTEIFESRKVVVFIEDIDRCPTEKVMEVIESIKLILNSKNCIFFLGCDKEYLENALSVKYKEFLRFLEGEKQIANNNDEKHLNSNNFKNFSREYLEKIIQVPFNIPSLNEKTIETFIDCILKTKNIVKPTKVIYEHDYFSDYKKDLPQTLLARLSTEANINPRRIKRILNLIFLNYIFLRFKIKDNGNLTKSIDLDILSFLGFIREVEQEYYKAFLSGKRCKSVFRDQYSLFSKSINSNGEEEIQIAQNDSHLQNSTVNDYFKVFFENVNIKSIELLNTKLANISIYISVSNITTSENYKENNWGTIGEIKSEITNKKLSIFLNRLNKNEIAQDFIVWFFEKMFSYDKYIIGLQKNIHLYKKTNSLSSELDNNFLLRFEYNEKENKLLIRFERGNNLSSLLLGKFEGVEEGWLFEKSEKQITLSDKSDFEKVNEIKDFITILFADES